MSAASVWMMSSINRPDRARSERPSALTTPAVTECWKPYGLPIAIATCPTRTARESPSVAQGSDGPLEASMRIDREVGVGIVSDDIRRASIGRRAATTVSRPRALDDVAVGEDQAVGREEDAGAAAALRLDLDDRRPDGFDGAESPPANTRRAARRRLVEGSHIDRTNRDRTATSPIRGVVPAASRPDFRSGPSRSELQCPRPAELKSYTTTNF